MQPPVFLSPHGTGRQVCANHQSPADKYQQRAAPQHVHLLYERSRCRHQRPQERDIPHLPQREVEIQLCRELRRPPYRLYVSPYRRKQMARHQRSRQLGTARLRHAYLRQPVVRVLFPRYAPYWDKPNPPYVPKEWNPTGTYRRTFTLPADWMTKKSSSAPTEYAEQLSTTSTGNSWA
mgnify:CR=1 FL=1